MVQNLIRNENLAQQEEGSVSTVYTLQNSFGHFSLKSRHAKCSPSFTWLIVYIIISGLLLRGLFIQFSGQGTKLIPIRPTSSASLPLTVLISTTDAEAGELDFWIYRIVSHLGRPADVQVIEGHNLTIVDDSIIVTLKNLQQWADLKAKSRFQNVGLLRIGDEYGQDTTGYDHFSYVLRPYWFRDIFTVRNHTTPVSWIPNGYSIGVGPRQSSTLLSYSQRPRMCYFEGSPKDNGHVSSRERMRQALVNWGPKSELCDVRWTSGFMQGRTPFIYSSTLGRAKYVLCPAGNNAETIRFYESLENNAIPIVVNEPWLTGVFGNDTKLPFIVLNSWDEVGPRLEALEAENPAIGQARQTACRKWWDDVLEKTVRDARSLVDDSFHRKYKHR